MFLALEAALEADGFIGAHLLKNKVDKPRR
jgi:hypothetical protein